MRVSRAAAPALTELVRSTFDAGESPDGTTWKHGAKGQAITLRRTGELARQIKWAAVGGALRIAIALDYAKYQIGKRPVIPRGELPDSYADALTRATHDEIESFI